MTQTMNFIGGELVAASDGSFFPHENPTTGEAAAEVPDSDVLDVVRAIQAANKAWTTWQKVEAQARARTLDAIADKLEERSQELARLQSLDQGTPLTSALQVSLPRAVAQFRFSARQILDWQSKAVANEGALYFGNRLPHGVAAILTPWSDPYVSLATRVAPALAAGNVVIAKPSEYAPRSAQAFAEVLRDAGLPAGVFNLVQGRGEKAGGTIIRHPGLSLVSFTGATETGRTIAKESAELLKRLHLALGARNPVLVFNGVDLAKVVPQVAAATLGTHPATHLRGSRVFVQESIYDQFLEAYQKQIEKIQIGDPLLETTVLGPLAHRGLVERYQRAVELAVSEKGKVLIGGAGVPEGLDANLAKGFFVRPTVIHDLTLCSTLQQEEIIGPFVSVASFKYQHDAISKYANNSPFGQAAWVFEANAAKANRVVTKLEAGQIFLNTGAPLADERMSFGGLKTSGWGREGQDETLRFFSRETLIAQNTAP